MRHVLVTRASVVLAALVTVGLAACSVGADGAVGTSETSGTPTAVGSLSPDELEAAVATYGHGPLPDADVVYQPDVIVIGGGPAAVRSVGSDGLVYAMDATAPGVSDLEVGSVMFATSLAVGRVVAIENAADDRGPLRLVTLGPIELTDLILDGEINLSQPLDPAALWYSEVPDLPGALGDPTTGEPITAEDDLTPPDTGMTAGDTRVQLIGAQAAVPPVGPASPLTSPLPPAGPASLTVPVGAWTAKASGSPNKLGLEVSYAGPKNLKVGIALNFEVDNLRIDSGVRITDGQVVESGFVINGIKGFTVDLSAGIGAASGANGKIKVELPVKLTFPIPPGPATAGLPVTITVTYTFIVETALVGQNSTLLGSGAYTLDGPIGVAGGEVLAPTFGVKTSIMDSISGITLGPSGIVLAVKTKVGVGLGGPSANFGPYGALTIAMGVTNGSALGAPLARCVGAALDIKVAGGIGLSVSPTVATVLARLLPKGTKIENSVETSAVVLSRKQVLPDVPLCTG